MGCRDIPMIVFPQVQTITYIHIHLCIVYVVKKVTSLRGLSQLMGVVHNGTHDLRTSRKRATCICSLFTN